MLTDPENTTKSNIRRGIASTSFLESASLLEWNQTNELAIRIDRRSGYYDLSVRTKTNSPKGKRYAY